MLPSVAPEVLEPRRRQFCVPDGVLNILVPEVGLQRACVVPLVGQSVAAGVPQHVWMSFVAQSCLDPGALDHACEPCRGERRAAL